ncbi:hypothetical protein KO481_22085 [Nocardia sp. NEAU-G5]|uniref:Uncharacterized protein n=1 Tax=Nocardia albiluteola TaxID=2842303 RepID=A0ABS6B449_9NOCA|nr:hypothetical protein [Nocardia albiluteola]MBU3064211.1 hypothetical protein [Nocardia albiluteola]
MRSSDIGTDAVADASLLLNTCRARRPSPGGAVVLEVDAMSISVRDEIVDIFPTALWPANPPDM